MFPVFTRPLGSRNCRRPEADAYWRSASASDALFGRACVFVALTPFTSAPSAAPAFFARTRSAHDLGGAGLLGACFSSTCTSLSAATDGAEPLAACVISVAPSVLGDSDVGRSFLDFGRVGMLGTAIAVLVSLRPCSVARVGVDMGDVVSVGAFVLGVTRCFEPLSDGSREVVGVSCPAVAVVIGPSEAMLSSCAAGFV